MSDRWRLRLTDGNGAVVEEIYGTPAEVFAGYLRAGAALFQAASRKTPREWYGSELKLLREIIASTPSSARIDWRGVVPRLPGRTLSQVRAMGNTLRRNMEKDYATARLRNLRN